MVNLPAQILTDAAAVAPHTQYSEHLQCTSLLLQGGILSCYHVVSASSDWTTLPSLVTVTVWLCKYRITRPTLCLQLLIAACKSLLHVNYTAAG